MNNEYDILSILPQRFPFLMIDQVKEVEPGKKAVVIKSVTRNEPHMQGHFPNEPIMPVVLMLEAIAQSTAFFLHQNVDIKKLFFAGVDRCKFYGFVKPGDTIVIHSELKTQMDSLFLIDGKIFVGDELKVQATLTMTLVENTPLQKGAY